MVGGWVGVHVSLVVACRVPYCTKIMRVKASCRHQVSLSIFSELYGFYPWQWVPNISLQRATLWLSSSWSCLGISLETLLGNNSIECDPVLPLETSPGSKRWPVEVPQPPLLGVLVGITFIDFPALEFHTTFKKPTNSSHVCLHSFLYLIVLPSWYFSLG